MVCPVLLPLNPWTDDKILCTAAVSLALVSNVSLQLRYKTPPQRRRPADIAKQIWAATTTTKPHPPSRAAEGSLPSLPLGEDRFMFLKLQCTMKVKPSCLDKTNYASYPWKEFQTQSDLADFFLKKTQLTNFTETCLTPSNQGKCDSWE